MHHQIKRCVTGTRNTHTQINMKSMSVILFAENCTIGF